MGATVLDAVHRSLFVLGSSSPFFLRLRKEGRAGAGFDGKIRKPMKAMKFGEGMQPGTVEWELNQRRIRAARREEDRQWAEIQAKRQGATKTVRDRLAAILRRLFAHIGR